MTNGKIKRTNPNVMETDDNTIICNRRVVLNCVNWDCLARDQIESGVGFRITEQGKTDVDEKPGYYSIHSPLYGTDYSDENAFEDRYSCPCGYLMGKHYKDNHTVCPKCGEKVEFVDIDMRKTGWIILDRDLIIQSFFFKKIWSFIGKTKFLPIIEFVDPDKRVPTPDNPFIGIGMIEFRRRFSEVMEFFLAKNPKKDAQYMYIMSHYDDIFAQSIPVYNMHLRQFIVMDKEIKYSDDDILFRKIFSNHRLLNDNFELARRRSVRDKRLATRTQRGDMEPKAGTVDYLRRENILYTIQMDINRLWELSFDTINKKTGIIRDQISGGRQDYTARNVIVPDVDLFPDEIGVGYITMLELYKLELVKQMVDLYQITYTQAWDKWNRATRVFDKEVYSIMDRMTKNKRRPLIETIGRNPSINYGSMMAMRIVKIIPDIKDHCLALPELILKKPNADFDGDIMNLIHHPIQEIAEQVYEKMNPCDNFGISKNDGLMDMDIVPFKDQIIAIHAFCNVD